MKKNSVSILLLFFSLAAYSQKAHGNRLQKTLLKAIKKAYPASVRIWGIDTVTKQQMSAQFSGVVVTADGYVITAAHVTVPGKTYKVMFPDGRDGIATALGKIELADDKTISDVAIMKIITRGIWPCAAIGSSNNLTEGQPCISIAYPESLKLGKPSIRYGRILRIKNQRGFIQSSCIMEPGDSGGPLFDLNGSVIGIHSAIEIPEACNYEVPVDLYKKYWNALQSAAVYSSLPDSSAVTGLMIPAIKGTPKAKSKIPEAQLKQYCVLIESRMEGKDQQAVGTLFSSVGASAKFGSHKAFIVSKSSIVGEDKIFAKTAHGDVGLKVAERDINNDLVLLIPAESIAGGIGLNAISPETIAPGKFLVSPLPDTASVLSVASTDKFSSPKIMSAGFFGAVVAYKEGPMLIAAVQPNSPAGENDIQVGDRIISINGVAMSVPANYGEQLQKLWPGDTIVLSIERSSRISVKKIVLAHRPPFKVNHPAAFFAGGKSGRMDGFGNVFSHDAILIPSKFGGPVFDLDGNFCGINIARYSRAVSLVIPADTILLFFKREAI